MPIYEYKCCHCGNCFEKLTNSTQLKEVKCEKCGKAAQRMISSIGIVFKGSGFYTTDYKRGSSGVAAVKKNNGDTPSSPETKPAEAKTEKKAETKSESKDATSTPVKAENAG